MFREHIELAKRTQTTKAINYKQNLNKEVTNIITNLINDF